MRGRITALVWAAAAVLLTLTLVLYPEAALHAARDGLKLFLDVVFPSLLPFFILSEIMLGLGVVHFIGVLFTPLMRPLFNVPGEGAFVLSMGLAAGYPMDAVITSRFRKGNMCTRIEGERMLAFSNTADPMLTRLSVKTPAAHLRAAGVVVLGRETACRPGPPPSSPTGGQSVPCLSTPACMATTWPCVGSAFVPSLFECHRR